MKVGDYVKRISHNYDITFIISSIKDNICYLSGVYVRLIADSPIDDLVLLSDDEKVSQERNDTFYKEYILKNVKKKVSHITGKILHFDSDKIYLDKCMNLYNSINLYAKGILIDEDKVKDVILDYIYKYRPDIIVITGHDSFNNKDIENISNYRNTKNFMMSILKVRQHFSLDDITIFAGACGSNFEALIASGSNFSSAINRSNIDAYDPAIVAILASITPHDKIIDLKELYTYSKMRKGSIGGVETYGKMRLLLR